MWYLLSLNMSVWLDKGIRVSRMISTLEVAKLVKISGRTLERWLVGGKIAAPKLFRVGGKQFRNWTKKDIARIRKFRAANYRKGRGRKKKAKR